MSSSDGFCSTLSFAPGELGQPYTQPATSSSTPHHHHSLSTSSSSNNTPLPTPTHTASPVLARPNPTPVSAGSTNGQGRAGSPARSSSASSIQTLQTSQSNNVINNPTPTLGTVPLVTATNSSQPQGLPLTTPPQTPRPGISHSATSSFSSTILGKRDIGAASESEKEDTKSSIKPNDSASKEESETQRPAKKRRIAPTLISRDSSSLLTAEQTEKIMSEPAQPSEQSGKTEQVVETTPAAQ